jgi:hypothetical protein
MIDQNAPATAQISKRLKGDGNGVKRRSGM